MVLRLGNGKIHVIRNLRDFEEVVEPEVFEAMREMLQDKPQEDISELIKKAEGLLI